MLTVQYIFDIVRPCDPSQFPEAMKEESFFWMMISYSEIVFPLSAGAVHDICTSVPTTDVVTEAGWSGVAAAIMVVVEE